MYAGILCFCDEQLHLETIEDVKVNASFSSVKTNPPKPDDDVFDIQKKFMYDPDVDYPYESTLSFDLDTWDKKDTVYSIENERTEEERYNLFVIKRKDLTKNTLVKV